MIEFDTCEECLWSRDKPPSESPLKSSVGVAFMISEEEELICEMVQSGRTKKKSIDGDGSIIVTSIIGLTTEIELSEMDEMIGQGQIRVNLKFPYLGETSGGCELSPREELIAREHFLARSKYYFTQSTKTLLKDFFVLNPPTVLDPFHNTASLSAD